MNRFLVEIHETIPHMVTVHADDEHQARVKAMEFVCAEVEQLAPNYVCLGVRPLQEVSAADSANDLNN